jgi:hypothetical protein
MNGRGAMRWAGQGERGMTLAETMLVLLVMSLVSSAVLSLMSMGLRTYWKGDLTTQVQQGGRIGLERMTRDLRAARRLYSGPAGSETFNLGCGVISFVLSHVGTVGLSDGSTIYATDKNVSGLIPYDGSYVSYYLAGNYTVSPSNANSVGPYLVKAVYDLSSGSLTETNMGTNVTSLAFSAGGGCPTPSSKEVTVTLTASQQAAGQNAAATDVVTEDVFLRNWHP